MGNRDTIGRSKYTHQDIQSIAQSVISHLKDATFPTFVYSILEATEFEPVQKSRLCAFHVMKMKEDEVIIENPKALISYDNVGSVKKVVHNDHPEHYTLLELHHMFNEIAQTIKATKNRVVDTMTHFHNHYEELHDVN